MVQAPEANNQGSGQVELPLSIPPAGAACSPI